ncbi:MAG: hypothetical protein OEY03_06320, partial [Rhizobacter sp.]|nr:hypothetical protein [Rhizobacter sp.]
MLFHTLLVNMLGAVVQAEAVVVVMVVPPSAVAGSSDPEPHAASTPISNKPTDIRPMRRAALPKPSSRRLGGASPPASVSPGKPEIMTTSAQIRFTVLVSL